jgi:hypothetical protein
MARASDDANVTISLEHCQQDVAYLSNVPIEPQVFEEVVFA